MEDKIDNCDILCSCTCLYFLCSLTSPEFYLQVPYFAEGLVTWGDNHKAVISEWISLDLSLLAFIFITFPFSSSNSPFSALVTYRSCTCLCFWFILNDKASHLICLLIDLCSNVSMKQSTEFLAEVNTESDHEHVNAFFAEYLVCFLPNRRHSWEGKDNFWEWNSSRAPNMLEIWSCLIIWYSDPNPLHRDHDDLSLVLNHSLFLFILLLTHHEKWTGKKIGLSHNCFWFPWCLGSCVSEAHF